MSRGERGREELYNRDSPENQGGKAESRRDFLLDVSERVGWEERVKGEGKMGEV